jgi:heme-degrading monooxygenase HmoA
MSTHVLAGRFAVKRGREDAFAAAWEAVALHAELDAPGTVAARLLQSTDDPRQFLGLWEFPSAEAIARWRADPGVAAGLARLEGLLSSSSTDVYEARVVVG